MILFLRVQRYTVFQLFSIRFHFYQILIIAIEKISYLCPIFQKMGFWRFVVFIILKMK